MICAFCGDSYKPPISQHECSYFDDNYEDQNDDYDDYERTEVWCYCCGKFIDPVVAADSFERHCECGPYCRPFRAGQEVPEIPLVHESRDSDNETEESDEV